MQRKQQLEKELQQILKDYPQGDSKSKALSFLNTLLNDGTLTVTDKEDLFRIVENKGKSVFSFTDPTNYLNLVRLSIDMGGNAPNHLLNILIHINKDPNKSRKQTFSERSLSMILEKKRFDLVYTSLINNLILAENYSMITQQADGLVAYIFQMKHDEKWQAFEYAMQQEHPLHLVFKPRNDLLNQIRDTIQQADITPSTSSDDTLTSTKKNNSTRVEENLKNEKELKETLEKQGFDSVYAALINNLIQAKHYPLIAQYGDGLVYYIFQMKHDDKWRAFEYALKQEHPLHLVLKHRNDLLALIRSAIHQSNTLPPDCAAPSNISQPALHSLIYPWADLLAPMPIYSVGTPNTVMFNPVNPNPVQTAAPIATVGLTPVYKSQ